MEHSDGDISEARALFKEEESELQNLENMRELDQQSEHGRGVSETDYNPRHLSVSRDNIAPQNSATSGKPHQRAHKFNLLIIYTLYIFFFLR